MANALYGGSDETRHLLDGHLRVGAVVEDGVADLSESFDSMQTLIERGEPALEEARSLVARADTVAEVELRPPSLTPGGTSSAWDGTT